MSVWGFQQEHLVPATPTFLNCPHVTDVNCMVSAQMCPLSNPTVALLRYFYLAAENFISLLRDILVTSALSQTFAGTTQRSPWAFWAGLFLELRQVLSSSAWSPHALFSRQKRGQSPLSGVAASTGNGSQLAILTLRLFVLPTPASVSRPP